MSVQTELVREQSAALLTAKWFFPRVTPQVAHQVRATIKDFATSVEQTFIISGVSFTDLIECSDALNPDRRRLSNNWSNYDVRCNGV